ncbi:MAG TPA: cytochrome P450 [Myxococcota bacterium]|jgi:cytochrome P450|nr:cytochrome P450 [Myxococcota bacterium]
MSASTSPDLAEDRLSGPAPASSREIPRASVLHALLRLPTLRTNPLATWSELYERHGPVVRQNLMFFGDAVHVFGPEANRTLMLDRDGVFSAKGAWDAIMGRIFTNGLLLRDGADHREHRKRMQVAFKTEALKDYSRKMNPLIARGLERWGDAPDGRIHAFPSFKKLTLDLACNIFLGMALGPEADRLNHAFEDTVAAAMSFVRLRIPGTEFYRGLVGREYMMELFGRMIRERRGGTGTDMFSLLCRAESEDGTRYSDSEIVDHMIFLMMAAHDTTTSTLTSMLYELAKHPEWQERVRRECQAMASESGEEFLLYDAMDDLPDVRLVLNETLRRYPPLSTIPRMSEGEFELYGYRIPAKVLVLAYPLHTHHMKEYWKDPFRFDPERFAAPREEHKQHTHLWVPFSGGAHMCLGVRFAEMQIRLILFQLVRRFRWSVPRGYKMPVQQAPISKPMDGLPLRLERIA